MKNLEGPDIPIPVLFNCWKHHLGFIKERIQGIRPVREYFLEDILSHLLTIGESQMDLYLGGLSPTEIAGQVIKKINKFGVYLFVDYEAWVTNEGKDYKLITLSDKTIWTLRIGLDKERYIHIHPARNTFNTIRVRAMTLKTAILVLSWVKINGGVINDLTIINKVRKNYLSEPPVKNLSINKGLRKLFSIFDEKSK
jgi:hypothetical protein